MNPLRLSALCLVPFVALATACPESESSLTPGEETAACNDGLCLGSLECRSDLCVDPDWQPPDATTGSDDDDSDGPSSGSPPTEPITAIDLLFVVDDTGSMGLAQLEMARAYTSLTTPLLDAGLDLRVAVTTTDAGNLWCAGAGVSDAENGSLVTTSCRTRLSEFQFNGFPAAIDATSSCTAYCGESDSLILQETIGSSSWLEGDSGFQCMLPQGVAGCGFESTLESMRRALTGAAEGTQGFVRDDAHLSIVIVSDEADCSFNRGTNNQIMQAVFGADGPRTFWSLPDENAPTSAVCWNAGVACSGTDCQPVDLDPWGDPATEPSVASLHPVQNYLDTLTAIREQKQAIGAELFMFGIVGVPTDYDGALLYQPEHEGDGPPSFHNAYGIGPGCTGSLRSPQDENGDGIVDDQDTAIVEAVPPARIRAVIEDPEIGGRLFSICADDYGPAFSAMATEITSAG